MKITSFMTTTSNGLLRMDSTKARLILTMVLSFIFLIPTAGLAQFTAYQNISSIEGGFNADIDDSDWFGEGVAPLGDLDGDGIPDVAISASGDDDGGENTGAIYILFLRSNGRVKSYQKISAANAVFEEFPIQERGTLGHQLGAIGDVDGDGNVDIAVCPRSDTDATGVNTGAAWILFLNSNGTVKGGQKINMQEGGFTGELENRDGFGGPAAKGIGDLDGDGIPDLAVGARGDDDGGRDRGAVYILFLNQDGTVRSHSKISDTEGGFTGALEDRDWFGDQLEGLGDFDGDNIPDLAVATKNANDGGTAVGSVWLLMLRRDGTVKSHLKINYNTPGFENQLNDWDSFGEGVGNLGDLDGNGVVDLAIGADYADDGGVIDCGATWILYLARNPFRVINYEKISKTTPDFGDVLYYDFAFGNEASGIGDVNGDGVMDLAVSSNTSHEGGPYRGSLHIFFLEDQNGGAGGTADYELMVSQSANRSNAEVLVDDDIVDGQIYVFVEPEEGIDRVEFLIDGALERTESYAPYDLAGGTTASANPFDTDVLSGVSHTISARIYLTGGGSEVISAQVQKPGAGNQPPELDDISSQSLQEGDLLRLDISAIDSDGPAPLELSQTNNLPGNPDILTDFGNGEGELRWMSEPGDAAGSPYRVTVQATDGDGAVDTVTFSITVRPVGSSAFALMVSQSANRANAAVLVDDDIVDGQIYVFVEPEEGIDRVEFLIDGALERTESYAPYDLAGGTTASANPFDTGVLSGVSHTISARIYLTGGGSEVISAQVQKPGAGNQPPELDDINSQSLQEGDLLRLDISAIDSDGPAPLGLSQTNDLPGNPDILTDFGNGEGELRWMSEPGDAAGSPYRVTVQATDGDGAVDTVTFSITVRPVGSSAFALMVSQSANRANAAVLVDDDIVDGPIYVFVAPEDGIDRVEFLIDGAAERTEGYAPYDLAGTNGSLANPFNANSLGDGPHTISARIYLTGGGSETVSAQVQVGDSGGSGGTTDYELMVSQSANRSNAEVLVEDDIVDGPIYVFVAPEDGIDRVEFLIDGAAERTEGYAPYDLAGTNGSLANPFNANSLGNGPHTIDALIYLTGGGSETVSVDVTVAN